MYIYIYISGRRGGAMPGHALAMHGVAAIPPEGMPYTSIMIISICISGSRHQL